MSTDQRSKASGIFDLDTAVARDTLFDYPAAEPSPHHWDVGAADDRRPETADAFSVWVASVAGDLALSAPKDRDLPERDRGSIPDPGADPLSFLLSKKALGSCNPAWERMLPGFYAFSYSPPSEGVRLLSVLYSRAHDPAGDLQIDHRAGYRSEPDACIVDRFFAAGFEEDGNNRARLAYVANHVDLRDLVCTTREDLQVLYQNILKSRIH